MEPFKRQWGFTYVLIKGKEKVLREISLLFTDYNLRRTVAILGYREVITRLKALFQKFFAIFDVSDFMPHLEETYADPSFSWEKDDWNHTIATLRNSSFNVFAKLPFNGPQQVIEYLGRYSHRVAITNHRIRHVSDSHVSFTYRDYRDNSEKILTLTPSEFARRFFQHILPRGFAKIRHFGILSNRAKNNTIPDILFFFEQRQRAPQKFNPVAFFLARHTIDITLCPVCRSGHLIRRLSIPRSRGDPKCMSLSYINPTHHHKIA